jgi:MFS transporter, Spinster family, sphingosine-1-phosphate transporter
MIRDRRAILALLTGLNFLNFIDRAVIAAVLPEVTKDLGLSDFKGGLLNTAFLIGYFVMSPLFGARADKGTRKALITLGVLMWSVATVASGLATGFWTLFAARVAVGVGEASYAVLAPTIIDDIFPPERKGSALSTFYLAIPLGYALGYIFGGALAKHWDWRMAFFVVGGPGIVLALSVLLIAEPKRVLLGAKAKLVEGLRELAALPQFRRTVLGYTAYTAALAGFSIWAPKFLLRAFPDELDIETANRYLGLVLVVSGTIGTVIGGRFVNRALVHHGVTPDEPYDSRKNKLAVNSLLRISAVAMALAAPLSAVGFFVPGAVGYFAISFVVQIALFATTSPVNNAVLRSVPPERRASAMAASIFSIHLFGDLWSAAALGLLLDNLPLKIAMMSLPLTFAWCAYIWRPRQREAEAPSATGTDPMPEARVHTGT